MSDKESIFYKRNQAGDIIINLNLSAVRNFAWWVLVRGVVRPFVVLIDILYTSINTISAHRPLLFIISGLGVGFGLGLVVFQRPMTTLASPLPLSAQRSVVVTQEIVLANVTFRVTLPEDVKTQGTAVQHLETSATLGQPGVVILHVGWRSEAKTYLENLTLNDPITVIGSNNGRYSYRVVEIKEVDSEVLPTLFNSTGHTLLMYTPTNLLQTHYLVVVAK